jgi:hypothetical protein
VRLPHIGIGTLGPKTKIRLFFPNAYNIDEEQTSEGQFLTDEQFGIVLNVIYQVVKELFTDFLDVIPPSYRAEQIRTQVINRNDFRTVSVSAERVKALTETIVNRLNGLGLHWASRPFFQIEIRGTKQTTRHPVEGSVSEEEFALREAAAFDSLMESLDLTDPDMQRADFYIDVGLEIKQSGSVLHWRESWLDMLTARMLGVDLGRARAVMKGSHCQVHHIANTAFIAGMTIKCPSVRKDPRQNGSDMTDALLLNVYGTDKNATYTNDEWKRGPLIGNGTLLSYYANFDKKVKERVLRKLNSVHTILEEAVVNDQPGSARAEGRVKGVNEARSYLRGGFDNRLIKTCVLVFRENCLW